MVCAKVVHNCGAWTSADSMIKLLICRQRRSWLLCHQNIETPFSHSPNVINRADIKCIKSFAIRSALRHLLDKPHRPQIKFLLEVNSSFFWPTNSQMWLFHFCIIPKQPTIKKQTLCKHFTSPFADLTPSYQPGQQTRPRWSSISSPLLWRELERSTSASQW